MATANEAMRSLKIRGGGLQNQREHHIILTKYEAKRHPTAVSEKKIPIRDANNLDNNMARQSHKK